MTAPQRRLLPQRLPVLIPRPAMRQGPAPGRPHDGGRHGGLGYASLTLFLLGTLRPCLVPKFFLDFATVTFSFLFDKHCPITE
jgi:hypothetical protein